MEEQQTGSVLTMAILAGFLTSIGVWQFGSLSLSGAEHEHEYEEHHPQYELGSKPTTKISEILDRIKTEENARIIEVEREVERGRDLYEIKLVGDDGRVREIKVDAVSGKVIDNE